VSLWRQLTGGLRVLLRRSAVDRDLSDEVQHYLDEATAAHVARGLSPAQALRAARLELGGATQVAEQVRASRGDIVLMVMRESAALSVIGVGIGLTGAMAARRVMATLLFGISTADAVTYLGAVALLGGVAMLACGVPAWRGAHRPGDDAAGGVTAVVSRQSSDRPLRRSDLTSLRWRFDSSRFSFAARFGLVGRRVFGRLAACWSRAMRRARAASRFWGWVRCSRLSMRRTPSALSRLPASATSRAFMSSGREDPRTSNRSSTAVDTLLTFCPPGPDARTNRSSSSRSSMPMLSVIRIMKLRP
jgi:hypothetical protein